MGSDKNTTPAWITALPGYDAAQHYNHFEIGGVRWQHHGDCDHLYASQPTPDLIHGEYRQLNIYANGDGFSWHSYLVIDGGTENGSYWSIKAFGRARTIETAAMAAAAHIHGHCVVGGELWYSGEEQSGICTWTTWTTRIGATIVMVQQRGPASWSWQRDLNLQPFRAFGFHTDTIDGECETAEAAMAAALAAPEAFRAVCRQYLADTQPAGLVPLSLAANAAMLSAEDAKEAGDFFTRLTHSYRPPYGRAIDHTEEARVA